MEVPGWLVGELVRMLRSFKYAYPPADLKTIELAENLIERRKQELLGEFGPYERRTWRRTKKNS